MPLLMRWLHISGAVALVGGLFFAAVVLLPALRGADPEQAHLLMRDVTRRFRTAVWIAGAALVLSGLYNYSLASAAATRTYHIVAGVKILLALAVLGHALGPAWPASPDAPLSRRRRDWILLTLLLGVVVLVLSSVLRAARA